MTERSVLIVKNITREGPGTIAEVLDANKVPYEIVDLSKNQEFPSPKDFGTVVVMGGPDSANDETDKMQQELASIKECLEAQIPYMGICLGMQTLVKAAGGQVVRSPVKEVGFFGPRNKQFSVFLTKEGEADELFRGLGKQFPVFHLHGETVKTQGKVQVLATGQFVENQIVKAGPNAYGIQSHFELSEEMLEEWLAQDPDLQTLDPKVLRQRFAQIKEEYTKTAWQLFTNFLIIANLID